MRRERILDLVLEADALTSDSEWHLNGMSSEANTVLQRGGDGRLEKMAASELSLLYAVRYPWSTNRIRRIFCSHRAETPRRLDP